LLSRASSLVLSPPLFPAGSPSSLQPIPL
jgi:hypothetical protein